MNEIWKDVPIKEFSSKYSVSNLGRIYSKRSKKCITPKISRVGYHRVTLSANGFQRTISIHRLVALAFIPNPENKPTVNHINECKSDNRSENLEWATNAEQNSHGTRTQRAIAHTDWEARTAKIDYTIVASKHDYSRQDMCNRKRTMVIKDGVVIGEFNTQKEAGEAFGVSRSKVSQCVSGIKKSCKGYAFEKIEEFPIAVTKYRFGDD